jgi:hypothetical protein
VTQSWGYGSEMITRSSGELRTCLGLSPDAVAPSSFPRRAASKFWTEKSPRRHYYLDLSG